LGDFEHREVEFLARGDIDSLAELERLFGTGCRMAATKAMMQFGLAALIASAVRASMRTEGVDVWITMKS
jgi:hypothetical protein